MPTARNLYAGVTITGTTAGNSIAIPVGDVDFIAVGVNVSAISGSNASATFAVQWSFDGDVWTDPLADPEDTVCVMNAVGSRVRRIPVKATYWRLGAVVSGTNPSLTVSANVLVW